MTAESALEIVTNAIQKPDMTAVQDIALAVAQKAIEKQIPRKVIISIKGNTGYNTTPHCPVCHKMLFGNNQKYCKDCGQALEWR